MSKQQATTINFELSDLQKLIDDAVSTATANVLNEYSKVKESNLLQPVATPWLNVVELSKYLPSHPIAKTIYRWVKNATIPCHNDENGVRFFKPDIDVYLMKGKKKTGYEIAYEANAYVSIGKSVGKLQPDNHRKKLQPQS